MADLSLAHPGAIVRCPTTALAPPPKARDLRWHLATLAIGCAAFIPLGSFIGAAAAPIGPAVVAGGLLSGAGARLVMGNRSGARAPRSRRTPAMAAFGANLTGAALGWIQAEWWHGLPALAPVSLPAAMGWLPALILSVAALASAAGFTILFEKLRRESLPEEGCRPAAASPFLVAALAVAAGLLLPAVGLWSSGTPIGAGALDAVLLAGGMAGLAAFGGIPLASLSRAAFGGLLLGYGALIGQGGLIGSHIAGVAQGSLHGWVWLATALGGAWAAGAWQKTGNGPADGADGGT